MTRQVQLWLFVCALFVHGLAALFLVAVQPTADEPRYLEGAANLIQGYFVSPDDPEIINGPGYPLLLAPLVALGFSLTAMRLVSVLLMAFATWFTYRAVLPYAGPTWAFGVASVLVIHPILINTVPYVMSEGLAIFCLAGFGWAITSFLRQERIGILPLLACVLALGWLVLTRVLFGYVIVVMLAVILTGALIRRRMTKPWFKASLVLTLSFGFCVPYLAYTYQLTGQAFKWSTNGGELLYWATNTHPQELGDWFPRSEVKAMPELARNHGEFLENMAALPALEREAAFRKRAMENIRENPASVLRNWVANVNRLVFGFPRSYHNEEVRTTAKIAAQVPVLVFGVLALLCMACSPRHTRPEIWLLSGLTIIYLSMSTLLPSLPRYFIIVLPWIGLAGAVTLCTRLQLRLILRPRDEAHHR